MSLKYEPAWEPLHIGGGGYLKVVRAMARTRYSRPGASPVVEGLGFGVWGLGFRVWGLPEGRRGARRGAGRGGAALGVGG